MELKLELLKVLARVPEKLLPGILKTWMNQQFNETIAAKKMEINRANWQLVQDFEELKALAEDPRIPENIREEYRIKLEDFGKRLDQFQEEKAQLDTKSNAGGR